MHACLIAPLESWTLAFEDWRASLLVAPDLRYLAIFLQLQIRFAFALKLTAEMAPRFCVAVGVQVNDCDNRAVIFDCQAVKARNPFVAFLGVVYVVHSVRNAIDENRMQSAKKFRLPFCLQPKCL